MKTEIKGVNKMVLSHERHQLPPHGREGPAAYEPTHMEIMEKLEIIEDLLRKIEERR